jgi:hypothetical protein
MKIISITSGIISIKALKKEPRYIISVHKFALKRRNTREKQAGAEAELLCGSETPIAMFTGR